MSLFASIVSEPEVKVATPDEVAKAIADEVLRLAVQHVDSFIVGMNNMMRAVWQCQQPNVTAEMIVAKMGNKAASLFAGHSAVCQTLIAQEPTLVKNIDAPPAWAEIDVKQDGTVVVTRKQV